MNIGEAVRKVRLEQGLTQAQVAAKMKAPRGSRTIKQHDISAWESGQRALRLEDIAAVEKAMGVARGRVLIVGGFVDGAGSVEGAVLADRVLTDVQKRQLVDMYEAFALVNKVGSKR